MGDERQPTPGPASSDALRRGLRLWPDTVRGMLVVLLLVVLVPLLVVQGIVYWQRIDVRRNEELKANVAVAKATAAAFSAQVEAILRQELSLGVALTRPGFDVGDATTLLLAMQSEYPSIREVQWLDPRGRILASSAPKDGGLDVASLPVFQDLHGPGESLVSNLVRSPEEDEPVFSIARSIRGPNDELLGVVAATVLAERLGERSIGVQPEGGRHVFLIDGNGLLAHRWPEAPPNARDTLGTEPLVRRSLAGETVSGTLGAAAGTPEIAGLAPVGGLGWVAGASRPQDVALAPVWEGTARTAGVTLAVAASAFAFALWLGRRITGPVARLQHRAVDLGRGRPDVSIAPTGPVELRRLATAFSDMARNIRDHADDLEARRREAERARQLLRTVLDTLPAGVFVADRNGRIIIDNAAAREMVGPPDLWTIRGPRAGFTVCGPDGEPFPPAELPLARAVERGEETREVELLLRPDDGPERTFLAAARPVRDEDGRITQGVLVFQDISARKLAEREREQLAADVRLLLESTDEGIYGVDLQGRCTFMNRSAARMLGYVPDALVGTDVHAIVHHSHADGTPYPREACPVHRVRRAGLGARVEDEVLWRRDGTPIPVEYSSYPMERDGALAGVVVSFMDITERRRAEEERARLLAEREDLLSTVSHDLRTPLTVIVTQAQTLERGLAVALREERHRQRLHAIVTAARRMNAMIQNLVDAARIDVDALAPSPGTVDLGEYVGDLRVRLGGALEMGRVRFELPPLPAVRADPDHLERILTNLLSNALKYSEPGTEVLVSARARATDVEVSVADRGPGIPAEERSGIFERYRRGAGAARREGLGLGLYITRRLVEGLGGTVGVESRPGEGSTFRFTLPRVEGGREA